MAFSPKTNVMIKISQKLAVVFSKKCHFSADFLAKIFLKS
jgi:hypothetical protein